MSRPRGGMEKSVRGCIEYGKMCTIGRNEMEHCDGACEKMIFKWLFLIFIGASYGLLSSAGVFTVFVAIGLVPRFAGRTHTAKHILLYEEMVVLGTIVGGAISVFYRYCQVGSFLYSIMPDAIAWWNGVGIMTQIIFGVFSGMFVGCLALAIAEMLDSIPILTRRISFRHGIGVAVIGIALGKICGSLLFFAKGWGK